MANRTVQPRQPTREGQSLKREDERIREKADSRILDGRLTSLETISAASSSKIKHGLGVTPGGYFFARLKSSAILAAPLREIAMDANFVEIRNDNADPVSVALWVFR